MIRGRLGQEILNYFDHNPIGWAITGVDCRVGGDVVRRTDLSIFLGERWRQLDLKTVPVVGAPDIAVEIHSPSEH